MGFTEAVEFVLSYEGGLVDDPADPGGLTKFGISQRAYPDLDIRNLTREQAIEIYRNDYWNKCKCNELPQQLAFVLFDSAVNQGPSAAIKMLQRSLSVADDGIIGSQTIAAAFRVDETNALMELIAQRCNQYALNPNVTRYGLGWYRRVSACHQVAFEEGISI